jgi:hypothetical protein
MPRPRVISPENRNLKHVELDEGDWIKLKTKLEYGEASDLYDATYRSNVGTGERNTQRVMNMGRFNIDRILLYMHSWSFMDDKNQPVPVSADSIRRLDTETTDQIHDAINAIETENSRKEQDAKKSDAARPMESTSSPPVSLVPSQVSGSPTERSE